MQIVRLSHVRDADPHLRALEARHAAAVGSLYQTSWWLASLLEAHHAGADVWLAADYRGSDLASLFLLKRARIRKYGLPFVQLESATNSYGQNHNELACFVDLEGSLADVLADARIGHWDIFSVGSVPVDGPTYHAIHGLARQGVGRLIAEDYVASPFLPLPADWDSFLATRSSNFRYDLKRKHKKCEKAGLELRLITEPAGVEDSLRLLLEIEAGSWKQHSGTAIGLQPHAVRFYRSFLPRVAHAGAMVLYFLYAAGKPVAYDMGVIYAQKYYMLKTSFLESAKDLSPGVVLRMLVIQDLIARGVKEHDFLGDADEYKLRWTDQLRRHVNLYLYSRRRPLAVLYGALRARRR